MILASLKTKERLIGRLSYFGIKPSFQYGEMMFSQERRMEIPTKWGFSFMVDVEIPIRPLEDDMCFTDVLANRTSRPDMLNQQQRILRSAEFERSLALYDVEQAQGELQEVVEHAYKIQVPISPGYGNESK